MKNGVDAIKVENPEARANLFSRIFFIWTIPFFSRLLNDSWLCSDVPVLSTDNAEFLGYKLEDLWEKELQRSKRNQRIPQLWCALMKILGKKKLFCDFILFFIYVIMRPGLCVLLQILIRTFRNEYDVSQRCIFGAVFVIVSFLIFITENSVNFELQKIGMRMRTALSSLIYHKILKLNIKSLEKISSKDIQKLISIKLHDFEEVVSFGSRAFICPVQFIAIVLVMWAILGFSSLLGPFFIAILVFPVNSFYNKIQNSQNIKIKAVTRKRFNFFKEVIEDLKTVKMNYWEKPSEQIIKLKRYSELEKVSTYLSYQSVVYFFFIHKFSTFLSLVALYFYHKYLLPELAIPCSQFLLISIISTMYWIPKSLSAQANVSVTVDSITQFLLMKEVQKTESIANEKPEIHLKRLCVQWCEESKFDLRIEDIKIKPGSLCLVIGPTKAGKTTLLYLILNELEPRCGKVEIKGLISYCSQKPWIYSGTIRQNIICGNLFKESRYNNVANICSLHPVFSEFMNGDYSGLGPEGVVLEEDQKARINLASAIYQEADIYLIDDVLSMIDPEISTKIFDDCFTRYLARKTRIIVTNQTHFLDKADQIIIVNEGRAQVFDNLAQIKETKIDFYSWMDDQNGHLQTKKLNMEHKMEKLKFENNQESCDYQNRAFSYGKGLYEYVKSGEYFLIVCFMLILTHTTLCCCDYWLAYWSDHFYNTGGKHTTNILFLFHHSYDRRKSHEEDTRMYVPAYCFLILVCIVFIVLLNGFLRNFFVTAAKKCYEKMSASVLQAPMHFFQSNSIAKLFNAFTLDTETIDKRFPEDSQRTVEIYLFSIGCIVMVFISEWILIFTILLIIPYIFLQKFNLEISRIIKSLENSARFPILAHVRYTLEGVGVPIIRAYQNQNEAIANFQNILNNHTSFYRLNLACVYSFAIWSDLLCHIYLGLVVFGLILVHECVHTVNPSYAGLAILQVCQLIEILQYGSRKLIQSAQGTVSINKIIELSKIPKELSKPYIILADYKRAPKHWPEDGVIEFKNVCLVYSPRAKALDYVSFKINRLEKIGIVGKPGSGKSSLIAAIFNIYNFDGTILVDNVDIKLVTLESIRKNISIIQEPVMFSECIRYNLDPQGLYTEKELWNVLEEVNLHEKVAALSELINPRTTKFSKGEMLLFCLARAILRKNKIVILDEVGKNLDNETEELFYQLVKKYFSDCTLIYITNDLNPVIMECDRVIVMDKGQVVDFDHPFSLLESEGAFYKLVMEAGKSVYSRYRHLAYQQYLKKFNSNGANNI